MNLDLDRAIQLIFSLKYDSTFYRLGFHVILAWFCSSSSNECPSESIIV